MTGKDTKMFLEARFQKAQLFSTSASVSQSSEIILKKTKKLVLIDHQLNILPNAINTPPTPLSHSLPLIIHSGKEDS